MAASKDDKKAMDVAKPGKTAPDTSGRPVLITHRPIVQDPMVNQATETDEAETKAPKKDVVSHSTKTLQPVDTTLKRDETEADRDEIKSEDAAVVDAVAEQADSKAKQKNGEPSSEDTAKQENIQKLISDKTYFVPVGQVAHKRNKRNAAAFLAFILVFILGAGYVFMKPEIVKSNTGLYNMIQIIKGNNSVSKGQIEVEPVVAPIVSLDTDDKALVNQIQTALTNYKAAIKELPTLSALNSSTTRLAIQKTTPGFEFKDSHGKEVQFTGTPLKSSIAYVALDGAGKPCEAKCQTAKLVYLNKDGVEYVRDIK